MQVYFDYNDVRKLQIGCGGKALDGWLNTDLYSDDTVSFLDARHRFPFDGESFDYVFCEHMIEHLEYREAVAMLIECFRILKPRGRIRVSTPNLGYLIELYNPNKTELQRQEIRRIVDIHFADVGIYKDVFVINNFFRNWGHKFIYDADILSESLVESGFSDITLQNVGESAHDEFCDIESHGEVISEEINKLQTFVVEGLKPDARIPNAS